MEAFEEDYQRYPEYPDFSNLQKNLEDLSTNYAQLVRFWCLVL